jgi:hypothetical protein
MRREAYKCLFQGQPIGSTQINIGFQKIIAARLEAIRQFLPLSPEITAERMTHGRFDGFKCGFGAGGTLDIPLIPIRVPGLRDGFHVQHLGIEDSKMKLTRYANYVVVNYY